MEKQLKLFDSPTVVTRSVQELGPHPAYQQLCGSVPELTLLEMAKRGEKLFMQPLIVTDRGIILDGYKRWVLAQQQNRDDLTCLEYHLDNPGDILEFLVHVQLNKPALHSPFFRIRLAMHLEPMLHEQARQNQQIGGQGKGSSNLTNPLDVRSEIAKLAKVATGNVTKAKQVLRRGCCELVDSLGKQEISIHRAYGWSKEPHAKQMELLRKFRILKDINSHINQLLSEHSKNRASAPASASEFARLLLNNAAISDEVTVEVIKAQGKRLFITNGLMVSLGYRAPSTKT